MATETELMRSVLDAAGGDAATLPDNLTSTILLAIAKSVATRAESGADGVGIKSIEQTTASTADGGSNVLTITLTDGTAMTFTVKNGSKGSTGAAGPTGPAGAAGKSAYQYAKDGGYTGTEAEFAAALLAAVSAPAE